MKSIDIGVVAAMQDLGEDLVRLSEYVDAGQVPADSYLDFVDLLMTMEEVTARLRAEIDPADRVKRGLQ